MKKSLFFMMKFKFVFCAIEKIVINGMKEG